MVGLYGFGFWLTFYKNAPTIFVAVEKSLSEKCFDICLAHEIAHIIHFTSHPKNAKLNNVIRGQIKKNYRPFTISDYLMTDGIATYTSSIICPNRPEVLYVYPDENKQAWFKECKKRENELMEHSLKSLNKNDLITHQTFIFMSGSETIYPKRIGYFIGYHLIKKLSKKHSISTMMKWSADKYRKIIRKTLEEDIKNAKN